MSKYHQHNVLGAWRIALWLQVVVMIGEFILGFLTNSAALLGDALHMLGDVVAGREGEEAERLAAQPPDRTATYGYTLRRDLAVITRSKAMMLSGIMAIGAGLAALVRPEVHIWFALALSAAVVGLLSNLVGHLVLRPHAHHHDGVGGFMSHLAWDAASSLVAILSLSISAWFHVGWIDALGGIIIGSGMVISARRLAQKPKVLERLLQLKPATFNFDAVTAGLLLIPGVITIDHQHVTADAEGIRYEACLHVAPHTSVRETEFIRSRAVDLLTDAGVTHPRLEFRPNIHEQFIYEHEIC